MTEYLLRVKFALPGRLHLLLFCTDFVGSYLDYIYSFISTKRQTKVPVLGMEKTSDGIGVR